MNTNRVPIDLAEDLLARSGHKLYAVAAVAVDKNGRIFSWGWNHGWIHAENHCLLRGNRKRFAGSTVWIVGRKRKSGNPLLSRPCLACYKLLLGAGVRSVRYSVFLGTKRMETVEERYN